MLLTLQQLTIADALFALALMAFAAIFILIVNRILQRYVLREILLTLTMTLFVVNIIVLLAFAGSLMIYERIPINSIIRMVFPLFLLIAAFVLPVAMLFTVTSVYGRLSADNEILAARSSGIRVRTLALPAFAVGVVLSLVALYLNNSVVPQVNAQMEEAAKDVMEEMLSRGQLARGREIKLGVFTVLIDGFVDNEYERIEIVELQGVEIIQDLYAQSGTILYDNSTKTLTFDLKNVTITRCSDAEKRSKSLGRSYGKVDPQRFFAERHHLEINLDEVQEQKRGSVQLSSLTTKDLRREFHQAPDDSSERKITTELHRRYAMSAACIVFCFIGVPLGILTKQGNKVAAFFLSSLPIFIIYYPFVMLGQAVGIAGTVPPVLAMWSPNAAIMILGILLFVFLVRR